MSDRSPGGGSGRQRRRMPVQVYRLGEEPGDDLSAFTSPDERLAMVWQLTMRAWALMGQPIPAYERREMPGVIRRLG